MQVASGPSIGKSDLDHERHENAGFTVKALIYSRRQERARVGGSLAVAAVVVVEDARPGLVAAALGHVDDMFPSMSLSGRECLDHVCRRCVERHASPHHLGRASEGPQPSGNASAIESLPRSIQNLRSLGLIPTSIPFCA